MREAREVSDLGNQGDGRDRGHAMKRLQRPHCPFETPTRDRALQRRGQPLDTFVGRLDRVPILGERRLGSTGIEVERRQPAVVV